MLSVNVRLIDATRNLQYGSYGPDECPETFETPGQIYRWAQAEYGRCVSSMYRDLTDGTVQRIGWVFQKRSMYVDAWRRRGEYSSDAEYRRAESCLEEAWVQVIEYRPAQYLPVDLGAE